MSTLVEKLKAEIEATAADLGLSPSTIGLRVGQGGKFYDRLEQGLSVRTTTYETVMTKLHEMRGLVHCDPSHAPDPATLQDARLSKGRKQ